MTVVRQMFKQDNSYILVLVLCVNLCIHGMVTYHLCKDYKREVEGPSYNKHNETFGVVKVIFPYFFGIRIIDKIEFKQFGKACPFLDFVDDEPVIFLHE